MRTFWLESLKGLERYRCRWEEIIY